MKKIISTILIIMFAPYIIVTLFIRNEDINFNYISNKFVRVKNESTGIISSIPLEEYVKGVVSGEMPASFNVEALKAQAVAARSYVIKKIEQNANNSYDVLDTTVNQVYLNEASLKLKWGEEYDLYNNRIKQVVVDTKGQYITYDGKIIEAFYFSTSSGKTENSEDVFLTALPYLKSVDSAWDLNISPAYSGQKEYSFSDFYTRLEIPYSSNLNINILEYTNGGGVKTILVNGVKFKGTDFRNRLSLKSITFTVEALKTTVVFKTKGYGHGVGMSQYGAQGMANAGYNYKDIIKHYYQGVEISKI